MKRRRQNADDSSGAAEEAGANGSAKQDTANCPTAMERLSQLLSTKYCSACDCAAQFLVIIQSVEIPEQLQLFTVLISQLYVWPRNQTQQRNEHAISNDRQLKALSQVTAATHSWINEILRSNWTLHEVAQYLWDPKALLGLEALDERAVALGMILDSPVVPYAQIPAGGTMVKSEADYDIAFGKAVPHIALLMRMLHTQPSMAEMAVGLETILRSVKGRDEKVLVIREAIILISKSTLNLRGTRSAPSISERFGSGMPMSDLFESLAGVLGGQHAFGDDDDGSTD